MGTPWSDWSEEAFRRAKAEDKPILLLVGGAWDPLVRQLHAEFFDDAKVAAVAASDYVPVRVDPDRRPDINERYNVGGWPTIAFLTPAGSLIWGTASLDLAQLRQILGQLRAGYRTHRDKIEEEIRRRDEKVEQSRKDVYSLSCKLDAEIFRKTVRGILMTLDPSFGGFGREPKFPMAPSILVLLAAHREVGGPDLQEAAVRSLDAIAERGLHDEFEGGFFRYCETEAWTKPRTEKMCEENALLIRAFLEGWLATKNDLYRSRAEETVRWALRMLCDREVGLIFHSQTADDEYHNLMPSKRKAPPPVDRTMITSSAAQMCSAFLRASALLPWPEPGEFALRVLDGIVRRGIRGGAAHYFDPEPRRFGLARAQTFLMRALVDAHEFTGRAEYLDVAAGLLRHCAETLWSEDLRGVLDRLPGEEEFGELRQRRKNIQDNALCAETAVRLFHLGAGDQREFARKILGSFPDFLDDYGHYTAEFALAADFLLRPVTVIELESPPEALRRAALAASVPRRVIRHVAGSGGHARVRRGTEAFPPARTPEELEALLGTL